jgi:hypothetical protein
VVWLEPVSEPRFDPYAAPLSDRVGQHAETRSSPVRSGALMVLLGEAGRSLLWRMNSAIALLYRSWPDSTIPNRVIKLLGAAVVLWGAWRLTGERFPTSGRVATRILAAVAFGGNVARLVFALMGAAAVAAEPATMLIDALAVSACVLCVVPTLGDAGMRGWAVSASLLAGVYLAVSAVSAFVVLATGEGAHIGAASGALVRGLISMTMLALCAWAIAIASRLPRLT